MLFKKQKHIIQNKDLVNIFKETRKLSKDDYARNTKNLARDTQVFPSAFFENNKVKLNFRDERPSITLISNGTVSTAYQMQTPTNLVALLNFADALVPGGRVLWGYGAQEENICRCSNLYESLTLPDCNKKYYAINNVDDIGVMSKVYTDTIIYSRNVLFFRDDTIYEKIQPKTMDVITCPAPSAVLDSATAYDIYVRRISKIIQSAIHNGATDLVLGAWGCGAFHQDPWLVAKAFGTVLNMYGNQFNRIVFAIRPTKSFQQNSNYDIFKDVLSNTYLGEVIG